MSEACAALLPGGRRLHLQHGPIDLIIEGFGPVREIEAAYRQAVHRFETVLEGLVAELPRLRRVVRARDPVYQDRTARRMARAVRPYAPDFITPMAAVAGAVADEVLDAMCRNRGLSRAYVNNGGDIALHLAKGAAFDVGLARDPRVAEVSGAFRLTADLSVRGIATSGRRGRSLSFGIADSVTVLAATAAEADAAATMIANAVDLPGNTKIERCAANEIDPDSDLGERPVTVGVAALSRFEADAALARGEAYARGLLAGGRIVAAALTLEGRYCLARAPVAVPHGSAAGSSAFQIARHGEAHG